MTSAGCGVAEGDRGGSHWPRAPRSASSPREAERGTGGKAGWGERREREGGPGGGSGWGGMAEASERGGQPLASVVAPAV